MLDDFFVRALLGGIGTALAAGPVGAFVVWRRMAYFGEALANSALLGITFATLLGLHAMLGVLVFSLCLAALLLGLERQRLLPLDTLLSILAHGALAIGLLALGLIDRLRIDLMGYLFGDVLAVSRLDLMVILVLLAAVLGALALAWRPLLSMTVHADLAAVEGVPVERMRALLTLLVAGVIAIGMKVVGILLIISLLVVPAATARRVAATPEQMAGFAAVIGAAAVFLGLHLSLRLDVPAGPAITAVAVALFAATSLLPRRAGTGG
jgi:zinc transport system permease protein